MSLDEWFERTFGDTESGRPGTGWMTGILSVFLGALAVSAVLCFHFPALLTSPDLRAIYPMPLVRGLIEAGIAVGFLSGAASVLLRRRKVLGFTGMGLAALATLLGGARVPVETPVPRSPHLGLDWFLLSLFLTAIVFVPLERVFPLRPSQSPFRRGWTTDLVHFLVSHALVQVLSLLILLPTALLGRWIALPERGRRSAPGPFSSSSRRSSSSPTSPSTAYTGHFIACRGSGGSTGCIIRARSSTGFRGRGSISSTWS